MPQHRKCEKCNISDVEYDRFTLCRSCVQDWANSDWAKLYNKVLFSEIRSLTSKIYEMWLNETKEIK
jgi:hypothetical protein